MTTHQNITAIIYNRRGIPISIGKNSYVKSHTMQAKYAKIVGLSEKIFLHAEISAIVKCKDLSKAHSIFISRFSKDGSPLVAKPCKICCEAIKQAGIKIVRYT